MIAPRRTIGLDDVLRATETFWAGLAGPSGDVRLRLPVRVGVSLRDIGSFEVAVGDRIDVREALPVEDGPRIELSGGDWIDLLDGSTTVTDLFFSGRLKAAAFESWRAQYAQLFTLIRLAQHRPML